MDEFSDIIENKVFSATIEAHNSCYVKSLIVFAKDEAEAHKKIQDYNNGDSKYHWAVRYTSKLKEVNPSSDVIQVGHGSNPNSSNGW